MAEDLPRAEDLDPVGFLLWWHPSNRRAALRREIRTLASKRYWQEVNLRAGLRAAERRAEVAEAALAEHLRVQSLRDLARRILDTGRVRLSPATCWGLLADLPLTDDGSLDEAAFAAAVFDATAEVVKAMNGSNQ
jgi:hypothetical protein